MVMGMDENLKRINKDYCLIEDIREVMFNEDENFYQNRINEIIELIRSNILNRKFLMEDNNYTVVKIMK